MDLPEWRYSQTAGLYIGLPIVYPGYVLQCLDVIGYWFRPQAYNLLSEVLEVHWVTKLSTKARKMHTMESRWTYQNNLIENLENHPYNTEDTTVKAKFLQEVIPEAADKRNHQANPDVADFSSGIDSDIHALITERRRLKECTDMDLEEKKRVRIGLGNRIQQMIRKSLKSEQIRIWIRYSLTFRI